MKTTLVLLGIAAAATLASGCGSPSAPTLGTPVANANTPVRLATDTRTIGGISAIVPPSLAVSVDGSSLVVWAQVDQVRASHSTRQTIWDTPTALGAAVFWSHVDGHSPRVGLDAAGDGLAVWQAADQSVSLRSSRYHAGTGWEAAESLDTTGLNDLTHSLVVTSGGRAQLLSGAYGAGVFVHDFRPNTGWGAPELVSPVQEGDFGNVYQAHQFISLGGRSTIVWVDGTTPATIRRATGSDGHWDVLNVAVVPVRSFTPSVLAAGDDDNNTMVLWQQEGDTVRYCRQDVYGNWSQPAILAFPVSAPKFADNAGVVMGVGGTALLVYGAGDQAMLRRFRPEDGWDEPAALTMSGRVSSVQVAADNLGHARAVWTVHPVAGPREIWTAPLAVDGGWGTPARVRTSSAPATCPLDNRRNELEGGDDYARVAVGDGGDVVLAWLEYDCQATSLWVERRS